jgi:hypothetical protein
MTLEELNLPADLDPYLLRVIQVAYAERHVVEDPKVGQNRGARVDEYIRSTHLDPAANPPSGYPWCACFVFWCFRQAAIALDQSNPCTRTASVVTHWDLTSAPKLLAPDARLDRGKVRPGMIFCKTHDRHSHTGIVCAVTDAGIVTVEGNTNLAGSREGNAVVFGKIRPWDYVQCGFIDYSGMSLVASAAAQAPDLVQASSPVPANAVPANAVPANAVPANAVCSEETDPVACDPGLASCVPEGEKPV